MSEAEKLSISDKLLSHPNPSLVCSWCCVFLCLLFGIVPVVELSVKTYYFPCSRVALFFFFLSFFHKSRLPLFCHVELFASSSQGWRPTCLSHDKGFSILNVWPYWKTFQNIRMSSSLLPPFFHDRFISTWCSDNMWLVLEFLQTSLPVCRRETLHTNDSLSMNAYLAIWKLLPVISILNVYFMTVFPSPFADALSEVQVHFYIFSNAKWGVWQYKLTE